MDASAALCVVISFASLVLMKRRDKFDYVVETTGLADPGPVAQTFFMDEKFSQVQTSGIVTLADALT